MDKSRLRRQLKARRNAVSRDARRRDARDAMRLALRLLLRARRIGFYQPHGAEFDLLPLLHRARAMRRVCCLPVVPKRGRVLRFARLHRNSRFVTNRFGIAEPVDAHALAARQLDLLFLPLLGFDDDGHRLGMGGGYYDATLAYRVRRRGASKPLLVGVGYECQRVDTLPHDPWDAPLDAMLTERGLTFFKRRL